MHHTPVLHSEVMNLLDPKKGEVVLDVTLGLGGHAKSFLEAIGPYGRLIGIETDEANLQQAKENLSEYGKQVTFISGNFRDLTSFDIPEADILFADLGLSSPHIDDPERGFTFREDAPLDMRFDRTNGMPASQLIASLDEQGLAKIFWTYGELKSGRKLARTLKEAESVKTTFELKECVEKAVGFRAKTMLPQVFQALRIAVNDEMGSLQILLREGPMLLKEGGRMGVISFHSLEDRMVKQAFRTLATSEKDPVTGAVSQEAAFEVLTKKPVVPSDQEVEENPRARSAKLRAISLLAC
ncbi:16S rRNA (cytosine(1402)-N(4))-methyltransferase RsmH [Patescibacteria group bacterium]|nr:16S rRNA (cytosine(1402)-N(4))-methyltransferase RsmH [Patescibacteria group bacterium]